MSWTHPTWLVLRYECLILYSSSSEMGLGSSLCVFLEISKCRSMVLESEAILIAEELCACSSPTIPAPGDKTQSSATSFTVSFRGTKMPVSTDLCSEENVKVSVNFFFSLVEEYFLWLHLFFPYFFQAMNFCYFFAKCPVLYGTVRNCRILFLFQASLCPGLFILVSTRE